MSEAALEAVLVDLAEKHGWYVRRLAWRGRRGAPDLFLAKNGYVVLIELKVPGRHATGQQVQEHARLGAAGVLVAVVDNPVAFLAVLNAVQGEAE